MFPSSLRSVSFRSLRCLRGKSLALLIGEFLETLLQPLSPKFTGLGYHFALDIGYTRQRLLGCVHMSTVLPLGCFCVDRGIVNPSIIRTLSRCTHLLSGSQQAVDNGRRSAKVSGS